MSDEEAKSPSEELALGHEGAGSDCLGKAIDYGGKGLLIGGLNHIAAVQKSRGGGADLE